ncbi:MAG: divergent polysaccharide deacetylase family protein, partial [Myxococcota bacterium]
LEVVALLRAAQVEYLCHLPMESATGANPGPNAILETLSPERIGARTRAALDELPGAAGVNNHMGSATTADPVAIGTVLDIVAERRLFFLDSRTTRESVAFDLARTRAIPAARRDLFLDEAPDEASVEAAFDRLLEIAREKGAAIAIGHPRRETLAVLERRIPLAKAAGFELVPVSYLLERDEESP